MKPLMNARMLLFLAGLTTVTVTIYFLFRNKTYYDFLLWNLLLAWIPLAVSLAAFYINKRSHNRIHGAALALLGMVWLLFFPNAPYIVTDLMHLTASAGRLAYIEHGRLIPGYWHDLLVIVLFAWNGLLLGFSSMYLFQTIIGARLNKTLSWAFVAVVSWLGGYGILLGRQYRLNSWDVATDAKAVLSILQHTVSGQSLRFCSLFALMILVVYATFYFLINGAARDSRDAGRLT